LNGETEITFTTSRNGSTYTIQREGANKQWQVLLCGVERIAELKNGTVANLPEGVLVKLDADTQAIEIKTLD